MQICSSDSDVVLASPLSGKKLEVDAWSLNRPPARRTTQALHPTHLHVNKSLFTRDTVQSRLPDPEWLERWLDTQIKFDAVWETRVVERLLHNLGLLLNQNFKTVQELNHYCKALGRELGAAAATGASAQPA